jgi:hypothetical protein
MPEEQLVIDTTEVFETTYYKKHPYRPSGRRRYFDELAQKISTGVENGFLTQHKLQKTWIKHRPQSPHCRHSPPVKAAPCTNDLCGWLLRSKTFLRLILHWSEADVCPAFLRGARGRWP